MCCVDIRAGEVGLPMSFAGQKIMNKSQILDMELFTLLNFGLSLI